MVRQFHVIRLILRVLPVVNVTVADSVHRAL